MFAISLFLSSCCPLSSNNHTQLGMAARLQSHTKLAAKLELVFSYHISTLRKTKEDGMKRAKTKRKILRQTSWHLLMGRNAPLPLIIHDSCKAAEGVATA